MNLLLCLVIHTANVLGSFNDPFEFEGDYGPEVNPVRQKVFERVVSKEALSKNFTDLAIAKDRQHGPVLSELITPDLMNALIEKQQELQRMGFSATDLKNIIDFINRYKDQKIFYFLRNNPPELLSLDKILRDQASREGRIFDLPILSSTQSLGGRNSEELKMDLLRKLFTEEIFKVTKSEDILRKALAELDDTYLEQFFGQECHKQDLQVFCTPAGQIFFYWLYQALNLHLISEDVRMIEQVNKVKELFADTIGDPRVRAEAFKEKLIAAGSGVVFTQESDTFVPQALLKGERFLPVDKQNPQDGTFVFLRSDLWEADYTVLSLKGYDGYGKGRINLILATRKQSGEKFLLASAHGNSTRPEDGRLQISLVKEKFEFLRRQPENGGLQLLIGIDANTKTADDVKALREHLDAHGLVGTSAGPTTIKQRMVTTQHAKAGRIAIDEEDYLITLKPESGGAFLVTDITVGFSGKKADIKIALPNINNPSDHYPVGATFLDLRA